MVGSKTRRGNKGAGSLLGSSLGVCLRERELDGNTVGRKSVDDGFIKASAESLERAGPSCFSGSQWLGSGASNKGRDLGRPQRYPLRAIPGKGYMEDGHQLPALSAETAVPSLRGTEDPAVQGGAHETAHCGAGLLRSASGSCLPGMPPEASAPDAASLPGAGLGAELTLIAFLVLSKHLCWARWLARWCDSACHPGDWSPPPSLRHGGST